MNVFARMARLSIPTAQPSGIPHAGEGLPTSRMFMPGRLLLPAAVLLFVIVLVLIALRRPGEKPVRLGSTHSPAESIRYDRGVWYWIERAKDSGITLMRADHAGIRVLATSLASDHYAVAEGTVAWVTRQGSDWSVRIQEEAQAAPRTLWTGPEEPKGLALGKGRALWLRRVPPAVSDPSPLPPLAASLEIMAAPLPSGAAVPLARVWEPDDGEVLGEQGGALIVAAYHRASPPSLSLYRISAPGAIPMRVAGETGSPSTLLTRSGELYWLAPSREGTSSYCLRHLTPKDQAETLMDWLPVGGTLHETDRGVLYADHSPDAALWPIARPGVFSEPLSLPEGYVALAAGGSEMLLASLTQGPRDNPIYSVRLP